MGGDSARRNQNLYCTYHQEKGHTTEQCKVLKDHLELLVKARFEGVHSCTRRQYSRVDLKEMREHTPTAIGGYRGYTCSFNWHDFESM